MEEDHGVEGRHGQGGSRKERRRAALEIELKLARAEQLVAEAIQQVREEIDPAGLPAVTVNLAQAARALAVPAGTIRHAIDKKELTAERRGTGWSIALTPLLDYGTRRYSRLLARRIVAEATGLIDETGRPTANRPRPAPSPAPPPARRGAIRS